MYPAAGVMVAKPAMDPTHNPTRVGRPKRIHSILGDHVSRFTGQGQVCYGQGCRVFLGMGDLPPLIGNPYNGYINPYYWVDDHLLLYGNNGSLDPGTGENFGSQKSQRTTKQNFDEFCLLKTLKTSGPYDFCCKVPSFFFWFSSVHVLGFSCKVCVLF